MVEERKPQYLHTEFSYFDVHSTDLYMRVTEEALSPYIGKVRSSY